MNALLFIYFTSLALVFAVPVTEDSLISDEKQEFIGHFSSSTGPLETFHITDSSKNLVPRGSFTYKWTVAPPFRRTFSPFELIASKKPHGTKVPELSHPTKITHPPQNSIYSWAPVELSHASKKPHSTMIPHVKSTSPSK